MTDGHDLDSDAPDAGLDAALRREGVRPGESVLEAIERRHGTTSRIDLARDPAPGPEVWLETGVNTAPRLSPVRSRSGLRQLPPDEQEEWRAFWDQVRALAERASSSE